MFAELRQQRRIHIPEHKTYMSIKRSLKLGAAQQLLKFFVSAA